MSVKNCTKRAPKGRPRADEVQARAEKLLDVATEVFLESGFERAKVADIVRRAGASKSSIYSRYPTKKALFEAVISRKITQLDQQMADSLSSSQSIPVMLKSFGLSLFETVFSLELRSLFKVVISEASSFPELAENFWQAGPKYTVYALAAVLSDNQDFTADNSVQAADFFISMCIGTPLLKANLRPDFIFSEEEIHTRLNHAIDIFTSVYTSVG
ncbi:putative HTH-type transcriptional regulator YvdT [Vibrio aerogenes CECT 7868]|uniref:Putative HTH-type transcriptional regulator YvdT n=1 Tax=Vibrio aerogenes CECT 7868 TaxID=1216006 RepID=A0A1M6EE32_9VIBR|nr:TetR/AcrR family transcriptional regulator [Vibrio aerogenes]SHI83639.1 putative HTH-type transcriptional regulator YvdT [Vibrio aerogenes CECT 7868]